MTDTAPTCPVCGKPTDKPDHLCPACLPKFPFGEGFKHLDELSISDVDTAGRLPGTLAALCNFKQSLPDGVKVIGTTIAPTAPEPDCVCFDMTFRLVVPLVLPHTPTQ